MIAFAGIALAACDNTNTGSVQREPDPNPRIDADTTPQSGTGGAMPYATPDGSEKGPRPGNAQDTNPNPQQ